ncbi:C2HC-type_zinc-finger domain-containing protein [Hexamita inflata]|uniref:C2HC-type zinc-finger domain-containing protein n=1 Tax=Hexamita inflata TaxID=28002 RepID=A0AA86QKJ2_9EUKA|nr:C2HC-type zinc-finger domain-containing protein [Hexamita inflata]CAI9957666.1 C2HC-type zinc-finger domain-containing protein [Hexamita inflata]CAI9963719.1 C2HC-type zinc-finger domain-containing protein [Hexamita inflata]CAI9964549.1 C2HC-type zinc-finger domain-containing protein [Hexamita inflata]
MDIPNGVMCRFCGKKWFAHAVQSHERNCRRKITGLIDMLFEHKNAKFAYPPEFVEWPLPPKIDINSYNAHAFAEYSASQQPCPRCGRRLPMIGMADHMVDCNAETKSTVKSRAPELATVKLTQTVKGQRPGQTVQQSIGMPVNQPQYTQQIQNNYEEVEQYQPQDGESPPPLTRNKNQKIEIAPQGPDNRIQCQRCMRSFDPSRIDQHERICQKVKFHVAEKGEKDTRSELEKLTERNQKGFDPDRYKDMYGDDIGSIKKTAPPPKSNAKPGQKSGGMGGGMGATKQPAKPQKPQYDDDRLLPDGRLKCLVCGRGFAKDRIDKHMEICKGLVNMNTAPVAAKPLSNATSQYGVKGAAGFVEKRISGGFGAAPGSNQPLPQKTIPLQKPAPPQNDFKVAKQPTPSQGIKQPLKQAPSYGQSSAYGQASYGQSSGYGAQGQNSDVSEDGYDNYQMTTVAPKTTGQKPPVQQKAMPSKTVPPKMAGTPAKFCHGCGVGYQTNAKFCHECGEKRVM